MHFFGATDADHDVSGFATIAPTPTRLSPSVATLVTACEAGTRTWVDASKSGIINEYPRVVEENATSTLTVNNAQQWLTSKALGTEVASL